MVTLLNIWKRLLEFLQIVNQEVTVMFLCCLFPVTIYLFWQNLNKPLVIRVIYGLLLLTTFTWIISWFQVVYEPLGRTAFLISVFTVATSGAAAQSRIRPKALSIAQRKWNKAFRLGFRWAIIPASVLLAAVFMLFSIYRRETAFILEKESIKTQATLELARTQSQFTTALQQMYIVLEAIYSETIKNGKRGERIEKQNKEIVKHSQAVTGLKQQIKRYTEQQKTNKREDTNRTIKKIQPPPTFYQWLRDRKYLQSSKRDSVNGIPIYVQN